VVSVVAKTGDVFWRKPKKNTKKIKRNFTKPRSDLLSLSLSQIQLEF